VKVLFFPYWPTNPYQPNLATALGEKGIIIQGVEDTSFQTLKYSVKDQDILHLHWTNPYLLAPKISDSLHMTFLFFRFLFFQKAIGRKIVWTVHNLGEHEPRHPGLELFCHRLLAKISDGIIVHSQYAQKKILETYRLGHQADKTRIIPHGNYIDNYPNEIPREQARARLNIGTEKIVFLLLGQIRPYKGFSELISAFTRIATGNELLLMAGKPLNEQIKTEISHLVADKKDIMFYSEFVPDDDLQVFMNAADAVVFPYRYIFTSGSILLAMSFAKAVIVPNLEGLAEITGVGGALTYDPQNRNGLEKALAKACSADVKKLGRLNFKEAQRLSWEFIAGKTADFYTEIIRS
jgi:beta-1,4-mannosyltransferase